MVHRGGFIWGLALLFLKWEKHERERARERIGERLNMLEIRDRW